MLPPFLLLEDSYRDVQAMIALLKRIGLVNGVRIIGTVAEAQRYLSDTAPSALPVVVFIGTQIRGAHGLELLEWMRRQADPLRQVAVIALVDTADEAGMQRATDLSVTMVEKPVEMRALIAALKGLGLAEKAKIDTMTLTVQVELRPRE
jgi:DNA-binding NarL/FixJ family response regulator